MGPNGNRYSENRMGPKIEPCSTPQFKGDEADEYWPKYTEKLFLDRYDNIYATFIMIYLYTSETLIYITTL